MSTPQGPQPYRHNQPPPHRYPPPPQHRPPQQYHQFQQPPQPQYGHPGEGIVINTQFFPLAWLFFFIKPKIAVDGYEVPVSGWGRTHVPARPGQHHVHVHVPYFLPPKLGPADATADVRPGQVAALEYKAPVWSFSPGSLGVGPQKYNGVGIMIAVVALPFVLMFLVILLTIVAAAV
ncbi:hypothetical protein [Mycobacterium sp. 1274761.0]|uniref:hypothetical protein n=1 Tax=Mycobacterium sp. 1274761.0 TaxID=1834077 RepID=UPI000AB891EC|nr:hypothetical protein [Mycobacterium sp. 1274761.0]